MAAFEHAVALMKELFGRDNQFALATSRNNIPSLRFVNTFFDGECFYIVNYKFSQKVSEIAENPNISMCSQKMYNFSGKACNIGHPLKPENAEIRNAIINKFEKWYFLNNDESDENMCYIQIIPTSGFFHKDGTGYKIDFIEKTVLSFPFGLDISDA